MAAGPTSVQGTAGRARSTAPFRHAAAVPGKLEARLHTAAEHKVRLHMGVWMCVCCCVCVRVLQHWSGVGAVDASGVRVRLVARVHLKVPVGGAWCFLRFHSTSFTRAQGIPEYKAGLGRGERMGELGYSRGHTCVRVPFVTGVVIPLWQVTRTTEPKVFVPHERRAGMPPRKVEVERKKRQYAAMDLHELLEGEGVDSSVPAEASAPASAADPSGYERCLPLHAFDNSDFEIRTPAQWKELVQESKEGEWACAVCNVLCVVVLLWLLLLLLLLLLLWSEFSLQAK